MNSDFSTAAARARVTPERMEELLQSASVDELKALAGSPGLNEDLAHALLRRRDLHSSVLEAIARNGAVMKHRDVILGVVAHPHTPRHVSLPAARFLYTFELMKLALMPVLAGDLRISIEETIIARLESVSAGERITLARSGSGRVACALLADPELHVVQAALNNPHMTEGLLIQALMREEAPAHLVLTVCKHEKWSPRREVRLALLRNAHTPLAQALSFAQSLSPMILEDVLRDSKLETGIKAYLMAEARRRISRRADEAPPAGR